jgi:mannose-6-phosphate isomerase
MPTNLALARPLRFAPVYHSLVWGGRRMEAWRKDLPPGPIGESWDLTDHPRGRSVVSEGPLAGKNLRELMETDGKALVGDTWDGGDFPLLVKLIDANDRLSVQVHPDDALAVKFGVGKRGKTECWLMLSNGGELWVGTKPGTTRDGFAQALERQDVASALNHITADDGDFFFLAARTVHALGRGCLLYEVQQTCDVTFRVDDWGRLGLDGKPRPLHVPQALETINYAASQPGPVVAPAQSHRDGGTVRHLSLCEYFSVEERRADHTRGGGNGRCTIITCLAGHGQIATAAGAITVTPMTTCLVPAVAGPWSADAESEMRLLVAQPA